MNRWTRATAGLIGGIVLAALTLGLGGHAASSAAWSAVSTDVMSSVLARPGGWRLMRGGLHYLVLPGLGVLVLAIAATAWRRDRTGLAVFGAGLALTNVVVQGVKVGAIPGGPGLNPLSGHLGVAAGVALSLLVFTRVPVALRVTAALVLLLGVGGGVLLAGWHSLPQVAAPIGLGAACVLAAIAVLAGREGSASRSRGPLALAATGAVALAGVAYAVTHLGDPAQPGGSFQTSLLVSFAALVAASVLAIGVVLVAVGLMAPDPVARASARGVGARN